MLAAVGPGVQHAGTEAAMNGAQHCDDFFGPLQILGLETGATVRATVTVTGSGATRGS